MRAYHPLQLLAAATGTAAAQTAFDVKAPLPLPSVIHPDNGQGAVSAQRANNGFFWFDAEVNGTRLHMALDTGASAVSLRNEDAARAGIDTAGLRYETPVTTPNGRVKYAQVLLANFAIGDIKRRNVLAFIAPPGKLEVNLIGQTFLTRIGGFRQEGNRLTLLNASSD